MAQIHLKDDFGKGPVSQVPATWYNSVAKFINGLLGGRGVTVRKQDDGSPSVVEVDIQAMGTQTTPSPTTGESIVPDFHRPPPTDSRSQYFLDYPAYKPDDALTGDDVAETPVGWERGKTAWKNGHVVDQDHPAVGCSITVCTHAVVEPSEGLTIAYFSRLDFDENGLLIRAVPCAHWAPTN